VEESKKRREGSDAALLLICVRQSCKLISQTQDISSKMGMDSTANAEKTSLFLGIPCEKTLASS